MKKKETIKQQYDTIRNQIARDPTLPDNSAKFEAFKSCYKDIITQEPALMEWEYNHWQDGKYFGPIVTLAGMLLLLLFIIITSWLNTKKPIDIESAIYIALGMLAMWLFIAGMVHHPTHYYHRITETGVYVHSHKTGKNIRRPLSFIMLLFGVTAAVISFYIMGSSAFAGAGGGLLPGIIMLLKQDPEPEEIALPWLAMFYILETQEDTLRNKVRQFSLHSYRVMCSVENFEQVKSLIKQHMRDDVVFDDFKAISKEAIPRSRKELPFFL